MKKYGKIAYVIIALIIVLFVFLIYKVYADNGENQDAKSKSLAEVKYLENKFLDLFNQINNINFENYKIASSEIQKESQSSGNSESSSESGSESSGGGEKQDTNQSKQGNTESSNETSENNKKFTLESAGILTNNSETDWNQMKNEVEKIYTSLYPTTIALYQTAVNQDNILNFNKEYDNLTKAIKEENKDDTLAELSLLYNYLPEFVENCTDDEKEKIIIRTKNYIFKAYSTLEQEDWVTISENINNASQEFTKLVTNVDNQKNKNQFSINKIYVMINEMQNAVLLRDKDVFLIKYKNILEELQNL